MGKFETEKNIRTLLGNIRNGNTQKWKIRENCYTEILLAILQYSAFLLTTFETADPDKPYSALNLL